MPGTLPKPRPRVLQCCLTGRVLRGGCGPRVEYCRFHLQRPARSPFFLFSLLLLQLFTAADELVEWWTVGELCQPILCRVCECGTAMAHRQLPVAQGGAVRDPLKNVCVFVRVCVCVL